MTDEELDDWFKNLDSIQKRTIASLAISFRLADLKNKEEKRMSEADKLFEELGFDKILVGLEDDEVAIYRKGANDIKFWEDKVITKEVGGVDMQLLKAINMKCKELRME